jgi:hypothetical protein
MLDLWKVELKQINEKAADALADPIKYPNLFPDLNYGLLVEEMFKQNRGLLVPASAYLTAKAELELDLISIVKSRENEMSIPVTMVASVLAPGVISTLEKDAIHNNTSNIDNNNDNNNNDDDNDDDDEEEEDRLIAEAEAKRIHNATLLLQGQQQLAEVEAKLQETHLSSTEATEEVEEEEEDS